MERYVCIHGHFYQPPRENPSLDAIEVQDSAYPYHDWNERITGECYGPNGASRILDGDDRIVKIANNYARMSFNFGPTLLAWMEKETPDVYRSVLDADRESREVFSGHGSALAQVYNHVILPLANPRDKHTQVLWGIHDFEHRFGRPPEGMWLAETAADLETLDVLAERGIGFTILAQHQAGRVRQLGARAWHDVGGGQIDPTRAYLLRLPSGRTINLFFYDGPVSRAVAFEGLLDRGENLVGRLMGAFSDSRPWDQLVHIATDGESYGHHHHHGDMALSYALHYIESNHLARLTNYGEYLEKHPPTHEVELVENTSWSCVHGIERWRGACGCNSGGHGDWSQSWRGPLRESFDWLRDTIATLYEDRGRRLLKDPWRARNAYISVVLDRSSDNVRRFLSQHATRDLSEGETVKALKLLEMQRHAMLMYSSCGWFFDELSGIETVQVMQHAGRALQLAQDVSGDSFEPHFLTLLERAKSNIPEHHDGRHIYEKWIAPSLVGLQQVGAHYAVSSLFESYGHLSHVYCYTIEQQDYRLLSTGKVKLAIGRAKITSEITRESGSVSFGVLHLGDHNLIGGVREFQGEGVYQGMVQDVVQLFERADIADLIRLMDRSFGSNAYSMKLLFRDEQRKILGTILDSTLGDTESSFRQVYEHNAALMRFLGELNFPLPGSLRTAAELAVNAGLRRAFQSQDVDLRNVVALLDEAKRWHLGLDGAGLGYVLRQAIENMLERFRLSSADLALLQKLEEVMDVVRALPFDVPLWKAQNVYYQLLLQVTPLLQTGALRNAETAQAWLTHFASLGEKLGFRVEEMKANQIDTFAAVRSLIEETAALRRVPRATYRLQFNSAFTFQDARALIPYLHDLGISDCYASPLFKPRASSTHGYDICDHSQLNPALGAKEDFDAFVADLQARGMGLILDVVPNHMGIGEESNVWWMDVLENGPSSSYADYFDIDWQPVKSELHNKVLLPILGDQYGKVLSNGELKLCYQAGAFHIQYWEAKLPIAPRTYTSILKHQLPALVQALGHDHEHVLELQSIVTALGYLPPRTERDPEKLAERRREKELLKGRIAALYQASDEARSAIDAAVRIFNGTVGDPRSFDLLDALLDAQAYRPAFWRVATEEINYRRFFDINELAAIRVELPEVFQSTHHLVQRLLAEGKVTGLRIDHPDGLWDPHNYFRLLQVSYVSHRVQTLLGTERGYADVPTAVSSWYARRFESSNGAAPAWPLYVVAEKILNKNESLPSDWAVDGTTGYDFLSAVNGLFVDSANGRAFDKIYAQFVGEHLAFHNLTNYTKKMIMLVAMVSEINALSHKLERVAEKNRLYRDFTLNSLTFAMREVIAALPVYRTYVAGVDSVGQRDQGYIETAVEEAKRRNPRTAAAIFDFIRDTLLLRNVRDFDEDDQRTLVDLVMKFQQVTGPVMAKGVEDTAFYIYNRLASLNEVGGHPDQFGVSVAEFHCENRERAQRWPRSLLATSTHDTKRSEDVRARIHVLSEIPGEWKAALARWSRLNATKKTQVDGLPAPDRNDEYLLYQTLLGTWPDHAVTREALADYRERIVAYMRKATKEAKVHTSWVNPNEQYDAAVQQFVQRVLPVRDRDPFIRDLMAMQRRIAFFGRFNALSQVLLKLTAPGVPDIYQGAELWDYSLVDPDNRRPVDYTQRRVLLSQLIDRVKSDGDSLGALARDLVETSQDGRIKLYLSYRTLNFRRYNDQLFAVGSYLPLTVRGQKRDHVCAFARVLGDRMAVVVVPRLVARLVDGVERPPLGPEVWEDTRLVLRRKRGQAYRNVFTGEIVRVEEDDGVPVLPLATVCATFPVALLERITE